MNEKDIISLIKSEIENGTNKTKLAEKMGLSRQFINMVLSGKHKPSEKMFNYFGYHKVCKWVKIN